MRGAWIALIAALVMLASSASQAHRISTRSGPPPAGVSIPSLTHGQMVVIRDNLPAIKALASARLASPVMIDFLMGTASSSRRITPAR